MKKRVLSILLACFLMMTSVVIALPQHTHVHAEELESWDLGTDYSTSVTNGPFTLSAINLTDGTEIVPVPSTTAKNWEGKITHAWQATVPYYTAGGAVDAKDAFAFAKGLTSTDNTITSKPSATYDANKNPIRIASVIVFTAPADGYYYYDYAAKQHWGGGRTQTYYIEVDGIILDSFSLDAQNATGTLQGYVSLEAGETFRIVHKIDEKATLDVSMGANVTLTVTRTYDTAYVEDVKQWTLPLNWGTGVSQDHYGWDIPVKGQWELSGFKNLNNDIGTREPSRKAPTHEDIYHKNAFGQHSYMPSTYLATQANEVAFQPEGNVPADKYVNGWYVSYARRWTPNIFTCGDNSTYMNVYASSGEPGAAIFTAPENGVYSYSEYIEAILFEYDSTDNDSLPFLSNTDNTKSVS